MWFNNAILYHCHFPLLPAEEQLNEHRLKPCPPHARYSYGWGTVIQHELQQQIMHSSLITLAKEERVLPKKVILKALESKIEDLEMQRGYPVKHKERMQMAEALEFDLLPKAFCVQKKLFALLDHHAQTLIVNSSSPTQAQQLIALLKKTVPDIELTPLSTQQSLTTLFTSWVLDPNTLPSTFALGHHCTLTDLSKEHKRLQCRGYDLPAVEVSSLIESGLSVTEIALIWDERIEFTLTDEFIFKRIKCTDYLIDQIKENQSLETKREQSDAALVLLIGEWRALITAFSSILTTGSAGS